MGHRSFSPFSIRIAAPFALVALAAPCAAPPASAGEPPTIGIVEATLNGEPRTWYVLSGGDISGATVMALEPGRYTAVIAGFESREIESSRDPQTGDPTLSGTGSQMTLSFEFPEGATSLDQALPTSGQEAASVILMPRTGDFSVMHSMGEGHISVDEIRTDADGVSELRGTFSGTLQDMDGRTAGELTNGSFRVEDVQLARPQ